ncbi:MAG: type II toxin-antitoxin system prevent-host-death family antitoxin [Alkalispirochaeta sp.]|jgi:prevent-host-death family protein
MKIVNTHEAKTHLSRILEEVSRGEVYIISRNGVPIAELHPRATTPRTTTDPVLANISIDYNPTEVLSESEWGEIE